ncbi:hypothetical protein ACFY3G_02740 [Streptomyces phaeochromogenes]|uniref:hypothetical protein n=1 Tax=Streptomyces phaeochromogenes TaxID=1923 RepID=UPI0036A9D75B
MPDTEQTHTAWLTEQHQHAQASAVAWAQRAEAAEKETADKDAWARDRASSDYLRAVRLAEVWARVATALAPPQPPANGQPATYDLHVALDGAPEALDQAIRKQVTSRRAPGQA